VPDDVRGKKTIRFCIVIARQPIDDPQNLRAIIEAMAEGADFRPARPAASRMISAEIVKLTIRRPS
jgi:hypothetical protein